MINDRNRIGSQETGTTVNKTRQTEGMGRPQPPGKLPVDTFSRSGQLAAALQSDPEKAATLAERARAAVSGLPPGSGPSSPAGLGRRAAAEPGFSERLAKGAALLMSPTWVPLGMLWRFGTNVGQDLRNKTFSPANAFSAARHDIRQELGDAWRIAVNGRR